jgi:hypothetical protein
MESEGSLPCSQDPTTALTLSQINPVHNTPDYFPFNIIFPSMSRPLYWSLSFQYSYQNPVRTLSCVLKCSAPFILSKLTILIMFI